MILPAFILSAVLSSAMADGTASITVTVDGIEIGSGHLVVGLYDSAEGWDGETAIDGRRVAVTGDVAEIEFGPLPAGRYGIKMYHDVDDDGQLDTNLMGIPSEPFAFSNNAMGRFGPAAWPDASFAVDAGENAHAMSFR
ncbi:DUF2141 domain-containing protein [Maricaulis sp.]|uniref:DUF2141 domain-containing protein n=1 Tax=Maricaulis sp. TaxID=1486257 RepID=UPI0026106AA6|nr:DUF2141 domain-containing protein [Maricaulis sp.]